MSEHPIDAERIDVYAGELVDSYLERPELLRLALWDRLERDGAGMRTEELLATDAAKVAAIAEAQAAGAVSNRFRADEVLALVTVLASILPILIEDSSNARVREVVTESVTSLLR